MKDQLISFETAKLAKEKGFNEVCLEQYSSETPPLRITEGKLLSSYHYGFDRRNRYSNSDLDNGHESFTWLKGYSAPTQSLLQKWLREKHNINLFLGKDFKYKEYKCLDEDGKVATYFHKTYEKALEKGLYGALTLIK